MTLRASKICTSPWIAMIAAYAVALQMLLSVTIAGQHAGLAAIAPDLAAAICFGSGNSDDGPGQPPERQASCVLCAVAGADAAPSIAEIAISFGDFGASFIAAFAPAARGAPQLSPKLSQGPPQSA